MPLSLVRDGWCHMQMEQTTIKSKRKKIDFLNPRQKMFSISSSYSTKLSMDRFGV